MNRRFFWQIPEFIRYRTVFEDRETVLGVNDQNERRLFRKDTGRVLFTEHRSSESESVPPPEKETEHLQAVWV